MNHFVIFDSIQRQILPPLVEMVDKSSEMIALVMPIISIGVSLLIMIYGYDIIRGSGGSQYILELMARIFRPLIVTNFALVGGAYSNNAVGFFNELRHDLASAFGAKGANSYIAIDAAMSSGLSAVGDIVIRADTQISFIPANMQGLIIYACMAIIALFISIYGVVAALNLLVIDASLAVIFGLGPIFVATLAFKATSRFFDAWFSTALKYTFTGAIITILVGLSNSLVQRLTSQVESAASNPESNLITLAVATMAIAALLVGLIIKASDIASDLIGGASISFSTHLGAARVAFGITSSAVSSAGKGMISMGNSSVKSDINSGSSRPPLAISVLQASEKMRKSHGTGSIQSSRPTPKRS